MKWRQGTLLLVDYLDLSITRYAFAVGIFIFTQMGVDPVLVIKE